MDPDVWANHHLDYLKGQFERNGTVKPGAFLLATRNPKTGEVFPDPQSVPIFTIFDCFNEDVKDAFSAFLRQACKKSGAVALMFFSEVWMIMPRSREEAMAAVRHQQTGGSLEHMPGRREVLYVSFERRGMAGGTIWVADIVRPEGGAPTLAAFEAMPRTVVGEGRFIGMMENEGIN